MTQFFSRTNRSPLAQWWWTIDRPMVLGVLALLAFGYLMAFAASPAVAQHIDKSIYFFAKKQFVFLTLALFVFFLVSMLPANLIRWFAVALLVGAIGGVIASLFVGVTVKGASRWLMIAGVSVQPSELLKPAFVVVTAWLFARQRARFESNDIWFALALLLGTCLLLAMQPDFGQTILICLVWMCLFYLSGGSLNLIAGLAAILIAAGSYVYSSYAYFRSRIERFLDPSTGDTYQVDKAMDAIRSGGITGVGPGDGRVKSILPDAHADYVFAVAAEEGGLIMGCLIIGVFAFGLARAVGAARRDRALDPAGSSRADLPVRPASHHQSSGQSQPHAVQRHDASLHFLRRVFAFGLGHHYGHAGRADAPPHDRAHSYAGAESTDFKHGARRYL